MGDIRVRKLDDGIIAVWKNRAKAHGRSLEAELRSVLEDEATRPWRELAERVRMSQQQLRAEFGEMPDSTEGIRHERDLRG